MLPVAVVAQLAQLADPSVLVDLSGPVRAALSFLLVLTASVALLIRREGTVDQAIDRMAEGSPVAIVYGLMPFGLVVFLVGYLFSQIGRIGTGSQVIQSGGMLIASIAVSMLVGFGYLVVGAYLTQIEGSRRSWPGAVIGATLSAVPWLVLPVLPAAVVWFLGAAVGLGSQTRHWVHGARTVEAEMRS